jgi:hypothetical protein
MQTSFMHPPFGFALFYLRSVAARVPYLDRLTGKTIQPVTTGQIYWGAVPFVCIQVIMIGLVIGFPQMVMHYKGPVIDPSDVEIVVPGFGGDSGQQQGLPGLGLPPLGAPAPAQPAPAQPAPPASDLSQPPSFENSAPAQPAPPATDLSQPPKFD